MPQFRKLAALGIAITLIGLVLVLAFWPLTSVSGADLLASRLATQNSSYAGYSEGSRITIHERVLDVTFTNFFGNQVTTLELDDGDGSATTGIYVVGDARGVVANGNVIYASAVLRLLFGSVYYWEVSTPQDIHASWPVDAVFYGVMASGALVLAYAGLRKP